MDLTLSQILGKPAADGSWAITRYTGPDRQYLYEEMVSRSPECYVRLRRAEDIEALDISETGGVHVGLMRQADEYKAKKQITIGLRYAFQGAVHGAKREVCIESITLKEGEVRRVPFRVAAFLLNPDNYGYLFEEVDKQTGDRDYARQLAAAETDQDALQSQLEALQRRLAEVKESAVLDEPPKPGKSRIK